MHGAFSVRTLVALLIVAAVASPVSAAERPDAAAVMVALATAAPADPVPSRTQLSLTDRIKTGERSFARLLLGGRVMIRAREHASLRITEVPGAITVQVETGRIAVTVDRENLHPEDLIEVRTPHAAVSVPGDTLVVDVAADASTFTVLGTRMEVFRLDGVTGVAVEPPTAVADHEVVSVAAPPTPTDVASR